MTWFTWFCKPTRRRIYSVAVHLDGRHPYLVGNELDFETRDVVMNVPASSWNDAAEQAMIACRPLKAWKYWVTSIEAVK